MNRLMSALRYTTISKPKTFSLYFLKVIHGIEKAFKNGGFGLRGQGMTLYSEVIRSLETLAPLPCPSTPSHTTLCLLVVAGGGKRGETFGAPFAAWARPRQRLWAPEVSPELLLRVRMAPI